MTQTEQGIDNQFRMTPEELEKKFAKIDADAAERRKNKASGAVNRELGDKALRREVRLEEGVDDDASLFSD